MKKSILALCLASALVTTAIAAPVTYVSDPNHTFARFSYSHLGFTTQESRFDKVSGTVVLDQQAKTGSADITIDMASANTGSDHLNGHLQEEDFFNTEKYPTATFKGDHFKFDGDTLTEVDGNLTLKGITHPVALKVTSFKCMPHPMLKKDACGADATTVVKRSDYGMKKYVPYVGDDVTLTVTIEALKQ